MTNKYYMSSAQVLQSHNEAPFWLVNPHAYLVWGACGGNYTEGGVHLHLVTLELVSESP